MDNILSILINLGQILLSFNLGDQLTRLWNFIDANPFPVIAGIMTLATMVLLILYTSKVLVCRKAEQLMKDAVERANNILLANDVAKRAWECDSEEYKKAMQDFMTELKKDKAEYEAELEKVQNIHEGQMKQIREDVKVLKDERRSDAMDMAYCYCSDDKNPDGSLNLNNDTLIETAQKIYKFYSGKI